MFITIRGKNSSNLYYTALAFIILIHALILTRLIFFPYQELFTYPHFTVNGLLPYKQVLDQHFPGFLFLPINFATLGMVDEYFARAWAIGNVIVVQILLFFISSKILKSQKKALCVNVLYLMWQPFFEGWVLWIDSFLPLFLLPAYYYSFRSFEKQIKQDLIVAGVFLGMGILFKQVVIPLAALVGLAFWLSFKNKNKVIYYLLGLAPVPLLMVGYLYTIGVFGDFWYWTVTYNLTVFSKYGRKYPTFVGAIRVIGVFGASAFSIFNKNRKVVFWLMLFMFGSLAAAYARFDFVHFQPALPFALILTVIGFDWIRSKYYGKFILGAYAIGSLLLLVNFYGGHIGTKVFFFDQETKSISRNIQKYTDPGERIFIYGSTPHLYQLSDTLPAGDIYIQQFSWFMRVSEEEILDGIIKDNPNLVVADRSVHVDGEHIVDYAASINKYLLNNYQTVETIGTTEFLLKKQL
jgi:hypothetical protein